MNKKPPREGRFFVVIPAQSERVSASVRRRAYYATVLIALRTASFTADASSA